MEQARIFFIQNNIDFLSNILQGCLSGGNKEETKDLLYSQQIQNTHRHHIGECLKDKSEASIELLVINFSSRKKFVQYENDQMINFILIR